MPLTPAAASGSRPCRRAASALAESVAPGEGTRPCRGDLGSRVLAEARVLLRLGHGEKAPRRLDRGMSVNDRELERPLLSQECVAHGHEARQLPAALLHRPLRPQDEGERGGPARGQGPPQLVNAARERTLPGKDELILRQAADGLKPVLKLSQSGISRRPHRRDRTTSDGIIIVAVTAGRIIGVNVHRGISIASGTFTGGATVNADSRDIRPAEGNALGEVGPVHEALLEGEGGGPRAGRAIGVCRAGAGRGQALRLVTRRGPSVSLAGSSPHLRRRQSVELLLTPLQPLLLGDRDGAGRRLRGCQASGGPQANLPAFLRDPALVVGPERRVLVVSLGSRKAEPGGSNTRVGTALRRTPARRARATARAAMSVGATTYALAMRCQPRLSSRLWTRLPPPSFAILLARGTGFLRASLRACKPRWSVVTDARFPCRTVILPETAVQVLRCRPLVVSLACPRACRLPACGFSALSSCMGLRLFSGCVIILLLVTVAGLA